MRIVYVITRSDSIGGAHIHVRDLAVALRGAGHEITVIAGGDGPFLQDLDANGLDCRSLPSLVRPIAPALDYRCFRDLRALLAELRPDVVSMHSSKAGLLGRAAAWSLGLPAVFTAHGWSFTEGVALGAAFTYQLIERAAAPLADRIITVSEYDRRLALFHGIGREDQVATVENGIPDIPEALRARGTSTVPRIVMTARFDEPKEHGLLLRALARMRRAPWQLELIGDGPLRGHCEELAAELRIADRVHFAGTRFDVAERLAGADLFALVSRYEGLPLSILEAMRAGLPVVASDVGGVHEVVLNGSTGLLVPRGDEEALAAALERLLADVQLRRRFGAASRSWYERGFTFARMLDRTLRQYEAAIEARR